MHFFIVFVAQIRRAHRPPVVVGKHLRQTTNHEMWHHSISRHRCSSINATNITIRRRRHRHHVLPTRLVLAHGSRVLAHRSHTRPKFHPNRLALHPIHIQQRITVTLVPQHIISGVRGERAQGE